MEHRKLFPLWHALSYRDKIESYNYTFDVATLPDYGGFGIDLRVNKRDNEIEIETIKKENDNDFRCFGARGYCLPFSEPNKISHLTDPCLKVVERFIKNQNWFCSRLDSFRKHSRKSQSFPLMESALESLEKFIVNPDAIETERDSSFMVQKNIMELLKLYPDPFPTLNSNWLYTGGCLSKGSSFNLLHSGGERFDDLIATTIEESGNGKVFNVKNKQTLKLGSEGNKIHQIVRQETQSRDICAIRKKCRCDIFSIIEQNDELEFILLKTNHTTDLFSSLSVSPYVSGEILSSTNGGYFQLQSLNTGRVIWETNTEIVHENSEELSNNWWVTDFGAQPRSLLYMDRNDFRKADMRIPEIKAQTLLSTSNQVIQGEELFLFKRSLLNNLHYFAACSNHLALIDERFPQKPIHIWNHHLTSSPLYWSQTFIDKEDELLFFLATQNSRESSCLQLDSKSESLQPISLGSMWHPASPGDFVKILRLQGTFIPEEIEIRTFLPIIGIETAAHTKDSGFSVFQLTSVGDLYYQDYFPQSQFKEKTYRYGSGCEFLKREQVLAQTSDWMKDAFVEQRKTDKSVTNSVLDAKMIYELVTSKQSISDSCPVCLENSKPPNSETTCLACGSNEELAFNILKVKDEDGTISKYNFLTSELENTENKLDLINLDVPFDPLSRKMLSVWLDKDKKVNLPKRVPNEEDVFNSLLQPEPSNLDIEIICNYPNGKPPLTSTANNDPVVRGPVPLLIDNPEHLLMNLNPSNGVSLLSQTPRPKQVLSSKRLASQMDLDGFTPISATMTKKVSMSTKKLSQSSGF